MPKEFLTFFNPTDFLILLILATIFLLPTILRKINKKYNHYPCDYNGLEVAQRIIKAEGLKDVRIIRKDGGKTNYYGTISKIIFLSGEICDTRTIASCTIAAHKAALAIQDSKNLKFIKWHEKIFPVCKASIPYNIMAFALTLKIPIIPWLPLFFILLAAVAFISILLFIPIEMHAIRITVKKIEENKILRLAQDIDGVKTILISNMFSLFEKHVKSATDIPT